MTRPRREIVSVNDTPFYHIITRCARGAFLCGKDPLAGKSYDHRKQWLVERIEELVALFAIKVHSYAVKPGQYHILLELDPQASTQWTPEEVIERWTCLYKGPDLVRKWKAGRSLSEQEQKELYKLSVTWRERLTELSWFMKNLNQAIARKANKEDQCSGHFWVSRYKSQALRSAEEISRCEAKWDLISFAASPLADDKAPQDDTAKQRSSGRAPAVSEPSAPVLPIIECSEA